MQAKPGGTESLRQRIEQLDRPTGKLMAEHHLEFVDCTWASQLRRTGPSKYELGAQAPSPSKRRAGGD